jgi:hypothetical protein
MGTRELVLKRIEQFLAATGMTAREFGLQAVGDHKFVARLKRGAVTLGRIERAEAYMVSASRSPSKCRQGSEAA